VFWAHSRNTELYYCRKQWVTFLQPEFLYKYVQNDTKALYTRGKMLIDLYWYDTLVEYLKSSECLPSTLTSCLILSGTLARPLSQIRWKCLMCGLSFVWLRVWGDFWTTQYTQTYIAWTNKWLCCRSHYFY